MDALKHAAIVLALGVATPALAAPPVPDGVAQWQPQIAEASAWFGIPVAWIERVMRAESGGHTTLEGRPITSRAGAMGLMQLMPATWAEMRAALGLGANPHNPRDNILAGTAYLRAMYDRFGYPGLFAAYNAGPARYAAARASGRPLPAETRAYLVSVVGPSSSPLLVSARPLPPPLFVISTEHAASGSRPLPAAGKARDMLFAVRAPQ